MTVNLPKDEKTATPEPPGTIPNRDAAPGAIGNANAIPAASEVSEAPANVASDEVPVAPEVSETPATEKAIEQIVPPYLVVLLVVATILASVYWIVINQAPPAEDDNMQLVKAFSYYRAPQDISEFVRVTLLGYAGGFYPPLVYQVTSAFYNAFGVTERAARFSMLIWVPLLGYATYGLGKRLWGPWVGATAAMVTLSAGLVQHYARNYFLDYPLTAVVTWHYLCLVKSERLSNKRWTALWGLSLAVGFLVKWTFLLWIIIPDAIILLWWLFDDKRKVLGKLALLISTAIMPAALVFYRLQSPVDTKNILHLEVIYVYAGAILLTNLFYWLALRRSQALYPFALAAICFNFLAVPWYAENTRDIIVGLEMARGIATRLAPQKTLLLNWFYINQSLWLVIVLLPLSLIVGFWRKDMRRSLLINLIFAFSGLLLVTVGFVNSPRYTLPAVPSLAILCYSWIAALNKQRAPWALLLLSPMILLCMISWFPSIKPLLPQSPDHPSLATLLPYPAPDPRVTPHPIKQVLADLCASPNKWKPTNHPLYVWVVTSRDSINSLQGRTFTYYVESALLPLMMRQCEAGEFVRTPGDHRVVLRNCDYAVICWRDHEVLQASLDEISTHTKCKLEFVKDYLVDDDCRISLYRNLNSVYDY